MSDADSSVTGTTGVLVENNAGKGHVYIGHVTIVKPTIGIDVAGGATIVGDTIGGNTIGVKVESTGNATIGDSGAGDGNDIYGNTASGIEFTAGSAGSVTDNDFGNVAAGPPNGTDLQIDSGAGTLVSVDGNTFAGGTYIANNSSQTIDATTDTFGSVAPSDNTLSDLYAVEDKIVDGIDVSGDGLVRLRAGNIYVTPASETSQSGAIERAETLASPTDVIHVEGTLAFTPNTPVAVFGSPTTVSGGISVAPPFALSGNVIITVAGFSPQATAAISGTSFGPATLDTGSSTPAPTRLITASATAASSSRFDERRNPDADDRQGRFDHDGERCRRDIQRHRLPGVGDGDRSRRPEPGHIVRGTGLHQHQRPGASRRSGYDGSGGCRGLLGDGDVHRRSRSHGQQQHS